MILRFIMSFYSEIIKEILSKKIQSKEQLHKTKVKLCKKYKINIIPPDSDILSHVPSDFSENYLFLSSLGNDHTFQIQESFFGIQQDPTGNMFWDGFRPYNKQNYMYAHADPSH